VVCFGSVVGWRGANPETKDTKRAKTRVLLNLAIVEKYCCNGNADKPNSKKVGFFADFSFSH